MQEGLIWDLHQACAESDYKKFFVSGHFNITRNDI